MPVEKRKLTLAEHHMQMEDQFTRRTAVAFPLFWLAIFATIAAGVWGIYRLARWLFF